MAGVFNTVPWYQLVNNVIETKAKKRKTKYNYWYYYTQFLISIVLLINIQPHDFISTVNEVNSKITMQVILLQTVQLSNYKFAGCSMSQLVLITYACRNKHKSDLYRSVYNYMDVHHLPSASMPEHKWFSGKNFRLWLPFRTPRFDFCTGFQFSFFYQWKFYSQRKRSEMKVIAIQVYIQHTTTVFTRPTLSGSPLCLLGFGTLCLNQGLLFIL